MAVVMSCGNMKQKLFMFIILKWLSCVDVDAPQDLAANNIQTENCMLTWKPPRADITGYILSFESADGTIRVSGNQESTDTGPTGHQYIR